MKMKYTVPIALFFAINEIWVIAYVNSMLPESDGMWWQFPLIVTEFAIVAGTIISGLIFGEP